MAENFSWAFVAGGTGTIGFYIRIRISMVTGLRMTK